MLDVTLSSRNGNTAGTFPHVGYFGVTPVILAGTVHAKLLSESDTFLVRDVALVARCYEVRQSGPLRASRENLLWESRQVLWQPQNGEQPPMPPRWEHPFNIIIPPEAADVASGTKATREWRVKWRLEFVANHKPIPYVGDKFAKAFQLDLVNHRTPTIAPPRTASGTVIGSGATATQLFINPPHGVFGPTDIVTMSLSAHSEDPATSIRKIQVVLDRKLELFSDKPSSSSSSSSPPRRVVPSSWSSSASSSSSSSTATARRPSPPSEEAPPPKAKRMSIFNRGSSPRSTGVEDDRNVVVTRIAEAACDISSAGDSGTIWSVGSIQLPRRGHRWDTCETENTGIAAVSFEVRAKITLKTKRGTAEVTSDPIPVVLVSTTTSERAQAQNAAALSDYVDGSSTIKVKTKRSRNRSSIYPLDLLSTGMRSEDTIKGTRESTPPASATASEPILVKTPSSAPARRAPSVEDSGTLGDSEPDSSLDSTPALHRIVLPPLHSIFPSTCPTPTSSLGTVSSSSSVQSPPDVPDDYGKMYQGTPGWQTASDDEEAQPLRSRQKLHAGPLELYPTPGMPFGLPFIEPMSPSRPVSMPQPPPGHRPRQPLPSLDALGFGLPHVPERQHQKPRRPRTAPTSFGVYPSPSGSKADSAFPSTPPQVQRPSTSSGAQPLPQATGRFPFVNAMPPLPEVQQHTPGNSHDAR